MHESWLFLLAKKLCTNDRLWLLEVLEFAFPRIAQDLIATVFFKCLDIEFERSINYKDNYNNYNCNYICSCEYIFDLGSRDFTWNNGIQLNDRQWRTSKVFRREMWAKIFGSGIGVLSQSECISGGMRGGWSWLISSWVRIDDDYYDCRGGTEETFFKELGRHRWKIPDFDIDVVSLSDWILVGMRARWRKWAHRGVRYDESYHNCCGGTGETFANELVWRCWRILGLDIDIVSIPEGILGGMRANWSRRVSPWVRNDDSFYGRHGGTEESSVSHILPFLLVGERWSTQQIQRVRSLSTKPPQRETCGKGGEQEVNRDAAEDININSLTGILITPSNMELDPEPPDQISTQTGKRFCNPVSSYFARQVDPFIRASDHDTDRGIYLSLLFDLAETPRQPEIRTFHMGKPNVVVPRRHGLLRERCTPITRHHNLSCHSSWPIF
jgi:hypothetical protein